MLKIYRVSDPRLHFLFIFSLVRWPTSVTAIHKGTAQPHHSRHNRANSWHNHANSRHNRANSRHNRANSRHNHANSRHNRANSRHNCKSFNTAEVKRNGRDSQLKMAELMGDDLDDEEGLIRGIFHEKRACFASWLRDIFYVLRELTSGESD